MGITNGLADEAKSRSAFGGGREKGESLTKGGGVMVGKER